MFTPGVHFGSGIGYNGSTNFLLQPGIYLVQLSVNFVDMRADPGFVVVGQIFVNVGGGVPTQTIVGVAPAIVAGQLDAWVPVNGNLLLQVVNANSVVNFTVTFASNSLSSVSLPFGCQIIFTQLK
jgi:hypothetical protein